jgi:hypothetical protein
MLDLEETRPRTSTAVGRGILVPLVSPAQQVEGRNHTDAGAADFDNRRAADLMHNQQMGRLAQRHGFRDLKDIAAHNVAGRQRGQGLHCCGHV